MANVLRHKKFVMSEIDANHNKFWEIWEHDDDTVRVKWGRVSETDKAQEKTHPPGKEDFDKLCKSKEKKGYREVQTVETAASSGSLAPLAKRGELGDLAVKQIARGNRLVEALVKHLVATNKHTITQNTSIKYDESTGTFRTPIGVVTQGNIDSARDLLAQIYDFVAKQAHEAVKYKNLLQDYLMLIPTDVGRARGWHVTFLPDVAAVQAQNSILDALQASLDMILSGSGDKADKPAKTEEKIFDVTINPMDDPKEVGRIRAKYRETKSSHHSCQHLDVARVYEVCIAHMAKAYEDSGRKVGNTMELWHGSRVGNILSIFAKGMVIPPASASHCTGRMYGPGCYFSDQSTKSLNYAYGGVWDSGPRDSNCFMFLADVALGKYYVPRSSFSGTCPKGYDSTFAKAGASGVMNNEMIVYSTDRVNIKRLVEFASSR